VYGIRPARRSIAPSLNVSASVTSDDWLLAGANRCTAACKYFNRQDRACQRVTLSGPPAKFRVVEPLHVVCRKKSAPARWERCRRATERIRAFSHLPVRLLRLPKRTIVLGRPGESLYFCLKRTGHRFAAVHKESIPPTETPNSYIVETRTTAAPFHPCAATGPGPAVPCACGTCNSRSGSKTTGSLSTF
jgi:hypothetical protein